MLDAGVHAVSDIFMHKRLLGRIVKVILVSKWRDQLVSKKLSKPGIAPQKSISASLQNLDKFKSQPTV